MTWRAVRTGAPALVLALAVLRIALGDPFASGPEAASRGPAAEVSTQASAVLDGLALGDEVAGFEVTRIGGPADGQVVVELRDGGRGTRAWITRTGARGRLAPRRAGGFDLFYGPPPPGLEPASEEASMAALDALGDRVAAAGVDPDEVGL